MLTKCVAQAHFETVELGILSLFVFATLAGWGDVAQINYFGCDLFPGGMYVQVADVDIYGQNTTLPFSIRAETALGNFHKHVCTEPIAQPISTMAFFVSTVLTTWYIIPFY